MSDSFFSSVDNHVSFSVEVSRSLGMIKSVIAEIFVCDRSAADNANLGVLLAGASGLPS